MASDFPFRKLTKYIYLTLEAMLYLDLQEVCEFMFALNLTSRSFVKQNMIAI